MAKIISVVNQKGGTGKSACAANLGVGLALMNKKVLVVDADPQSDVSAGFGFRDCDNLRNFWSVTGRNHLQRQDRQKHFQSMKTSVERAFISKGEKNGI